MSEGYIRDTKPAPTAKFGIFEFLIYVQLLVLGFMCGVVYERSTVKWTVDPKTGVTRFSFRMGDIADD